MSTHVFVFNFVLYFYLSNQEYHYNFTSTDSSTPKRLIFLTVSSPQAILHRDNLQVLRIFAQNLILTRQFRFNFQTYSVNIGDRHITDYAAVYCYIALNLRTIIEVNVKIGQYLKGKSFYLFLHKT